MRWRLEAVDRGLAARLAAAAPSAQRRMAHAAALSAVEFTGLAGPRVDAAVRALDEGGPGPDGSAHRAAAEFAAELTDRYWDAHDAWADADDEVSAPRPDDLDLDRSCAAQSLAEALGDDPRAAALDAVYSAAIAVGGLRVLRELVRPRLSG